MAWQLPQVPALPGFSPLLQPTLAGGLPLTEVGNKLLPLAQEAGF